MGYGVGLECRFQEEGNVIRRSCRPVAAAIGWSRGGEKGRGRGRGQGALWLTQMSWQRGRPGDRSVLMVHVRMAHPA